MIAALNSRLASALTVVTVGVTLLLASTDTADATTGSASGCVDLWPRTVGDFYVAACRRWQDSSTGSYLVYWDWAEMMREGGRVLPVPNGDFDVYGSFDGEVVKLAAKGRWPYFVKTFVFRACVYNSDQCTNWI